MLRYKDREVIDICPKCKEYNDIIRLLESCSKYGVYRKCPECFYKITVKKFLSYSEKMKNKFPVDKEARKVTLKNMRESRKNVTFEGISIDLSK